MVFHLLKYWASGPVTAFYKHIQVRNLGVLMNDDPVIIAMNHPNAFTDPVLFAYAAYPHVRLHYMARGDAFRPGILAWFLKSIGIVPIFRLRDGGKEGLKKNEESYRTVNRLLRKNAKVIVFAEGLCIQERRLRPLKKGVARMVFGAYEALGNDRLTVVPVGINYSKPDKFRSNAFINIGEPIAVKDFYPAFSKDPARGYNVFLQALEPRMRELVVHINDPADDESLYMLEMLCKKSMMKKAGTRGDMYEDFRIQKRLTDRINKARAADPGLLEKFNQIAKAYFCELENHALRDWLLDPSQNKRVTRVFAVTRLALILPAFPLYLAGALVHLPGIRLSRAVSLALSRNKEFFSSFFIGAAMVFFALTYGILFALFELMTPHVWWTVAAVFATLLCGIFAIWYHAQWLKTLGMLRILKNRTLRESLARQRAQILELVNKF